MKKNLTTLAVILAIMGAAFAQTPQKTVFFAVSNETGRFTIPEVPTGKATVILEAAGYKRSTVEIDIEDNPRHRVHKHFEMEKAGDERDL